MKKFIIVTFLIIFLTPSFLYAKIFSSTQPTNEDAISAIIYASKSVSARPALLYGLFGQETGYGGYLGKTASGWNSFCGTRNTEDCRNWKNYDCKNSYGNANNFDEILKNLDYTDAQGNADRSQIPVSSTCAMGFTQFEPNTWWQVTHNKKDRVYDPWNIQDSILIAAYYLSDLGASGSEALASGEVIGAKDRIALQKYYCGKYYTRLECVSYAKGVEIKAKRAPVALLQKGLQDQLDNLKKQKELIREKLGKKSSIIKPAQYTPLVPCNGEPTTIAVQEKQHLAFIEFSKDKQAKMEFFRKDGNISVIFETYKELSKQKEDGTYFSYKAVFLGNADILKQSYTSDPNKIQWVVFMHEDTIKYLENYFSGDIQIMPSWKLGSKEPSAVEFSCGYIGQSEKIFQEKLP